MTRRPLLLSTLFACSLALAGCSHPRPVYYAPPPPPPGPSSFFQQGQHDGFEAARHDVGSNRPPDFNNHERFRNPPVPPPAINDYRAGFQQGYDQFLHQAPPPNRY